MLKTFGRSGKMKAENGMEFSMEGIGDFYKNCKYTGP